MGIAEKISEIEAEMARTQKNKATEHHLGLLKGRLAELRASLIQEAEHSSGKGDGFDVRKIGAARIALVGFPSTGKSTLFCELTRDPSASEINEREFCTLECIPSTFKIHGTTIQIIDLPGIICGAADGRGDGKQVIAAARSADLLLMLLDAGEADTQRRLLSYELEKMGLRLNTRPRDIQLTRTSSGGVRYRQLVGEPLNDRTVVQLCKQYGYHNCQVVAREPITIDDMIDRLAGNRAYVDCLYVVNKIDTVSLQAAQHFAIMKDTVAVSVTERCGLTYLADAIWAKLGIVRVWTRTPDECDLEMDSCITMKRNRGCTVLDVAATVHKELAQNFRHAIVWGRSARFQGQQVGKDHVCEDGDVIMIVKRAP